MSVILINLWELISAVQSRKHLLKSCILPSRSKPNVRKLSDDKKIIADKYWRGEAKVEYLQWTRVDFNMELFNGMLAFRAERMKGDHHDHKGTNRKRKSKQTNSSESSTRKKPRTETGMGPPLSLGLLR